MHVTNSTVVWLLLVTNGYKVSNWVWKTVINQKYQFILFIKNFYN